jgi:hypothetical protein
MKDERSREKEKERENEREREIEQQNDLVTNLANNSLPGRAVCLGV